MARILNPRFEPRTVRGIVWDMDGTLYSLTQGNIVARYQHYLAEELPPERRDAFRAEVARIEQGESMFAIGRAVDLEARLVIEIDEYGQPDRGWRFDGTVVPAHELRRAYPNGCEPQPNRIFYLGDVWWPPLAAAAAAGLDRPALVRAYYRARSEQLAEPASYGISPLPEVANHLARLRERGIGQAIVTNAIADDVERILSALGLAGVFDHIEVDAKKPEGAANALARVSQTLGTPTETLLMVGDNLYFDLLPARRCGTQTVLVGNPPRAWLSAVHVVVSDLSEALSFFDQTLGAGTPAG